MFASRIGRLARPMVTAGATLLASQQRRSESETAPRAISLAVHAELEKLRPGEAAMRRKWEEDEMHWHKLPPRAWPPVQPKPEELEELQKLVADSPDRKHLFDLATCLTFNGIDGATGLRMYRAMAEGGDVDAMVAAGTALLEGLHVPRDVEQKDEEVAEGLRWMRAADVRGHAQAQYEIGVLHYLGSWPELVAADERQALQYFEASAAQQHTSALFMLAEFLLEGTGGCEPDAPRAVRLLHAAAQRGHRMARQYVLQFLDADGLQQWPALNTMTAAASTQQQQLAQQQASKLPPLPSEGSAHFQIFRGGGAGGGGGAGEAVSVEVLLSELEGADVVLLGECHDDPIAHTLEAYLLVSLAARRPKVALSLEMFERDVQTTLDEYLAGLIREADLLHDARPWANYTSDYRPMVEFCKVVGAPVIAANAPRRYVGAVGRSAKVLQERSWPEGSFRHLPPLPLPPPSPAYLEHLFSDAVVVRTDQIGLELGEKADAGKEDGKENAAPPAASAASKPTAEGAEGAEGEVVTSKDTRCPYIGLRSRDGLLEPMLLWDGAMAHAIFTSLQQEPERLVVHCCGSFHCERRLGVAEALEAFAQRTPAFARQRGAPRAAAAAQPGGSAPLIKQVVVVFSPEKDPHYFSAARHAGLADFVVLTDSSLPRSHDYMA